ncbi:MAG: hypothetical protein R2771_03135 [Saprospiraceae bacterium]
MVILFFGGSSIKGFAFAMSLGILIGTYSSIFVAVPIVRDLSSDLKPKVKKTSSFSEQENNFYKNILYKASFPLIWGFIFYMKILDKTYYENPDVVFIAKDILGKVLVSNIDGLYTGIIVETEAYKGPLKIKQVMLTKINSLIVQKPCLNQVELHIFISIMAFIICLM